jgi:hypothetical protein
MVNQVQVIYALPPHWRFLVDLSSLAGKTVLASLLVEQFQKLPSASVVYFYNKYGDPKRNNAVAMLQSILSQLLLAQPSLTPYVFEVASNSGKNSLDTVEAARKILDVVFASFDDTVYLILDGLDECPKSEKGAVVSVFRSLVTSANDNRPEALRCCFFSQQDNDIGPLLKGIPALTITSKHNHDDIYTYCQAEGRKIQDQFGLSDSETQSMITDVSTGADGKLHTLLSCNVANIRARHVYLRQVGNAEPDESSYEEKGQIGDQ